MMRSRHHLLNDIFWVRLWDTLALHQILSTESRWRQKSCNSFVHCQDKLLGLIFECQIIPNQDKYSSKNRELAILETQFPNKIFIFLLEKLALQSSLAFFAVFLLVGNTYDCLSTHSYISSFQCLQYNYFSSLSS